jgi:hypothetical protein
LGFKLVMPGLVPGIHVLVAEAGKTWMAGTSPAMTWREHDAAGVEPPAK